MKQSIVKEATMSEFNGKKSYTATFEDGVKGYYDAKTVGELKQGDHVLYTAEEKTNKKGGKYNLLTVTKTEAQPSAPVIPVAKEPKAIPPLASPSVSKLKYDILVPVAEIVMNGVK